MLYKLYIGMEIHLKVNVYKLFSISIFGHYKNINKYVCVNDLSYPGSLPVLNREIIFKIVKFGILINSNILLISFFDRKHYFYPDLLKGFQITQYYKPIIFNGKIFIWGINLKKKIIINSIHIEQDVGKMFFFKNQNYIDFNRSGLVLLEFVTSYNFKSVNEIITFLKNLYLLIRIINVFNFIKNYLRIDLNLSLFNIINMYKGFRIEVKNINSFSFIRNIINYEIFRQKKYICLKKIIYSHTRLYNSVFNNTMFMRFKNNIYNFIPELNLLYLKIKLFNFNFIKFYNLKYKFNLYLYIYNITKKNILFLFNNFKLYLLFFNILLYYKIPKILFCLFFFFKKYNFFLCYKNIIRLSFIFNYYFNKKKKISIFIMLNKNYKYIDIMLNKF